jgi:hypothetical protein
MGFHYFSCVYAFFILDTVPAGLFFTLFSGAELTAGLGQPHLFATIPFYLGLFKGSKPSDVTRIERFHRLHNLGNWLGRYILELGRSFGVRMQNNKSEFEVFFDWMKATCV